MNEPKPIDQQLEPGYERREHEERLRQFAELSGSSRPAWLPIKKIEVNVIRHNPLGGPVRWAEGDYSKIEADGTRANATFAEYCASVGLPEMPNEKIIE